VTDVDRQTFIDARKKQPDAKISAFVMAAARPEVVANTVVGKWKRYQISVINHQQARA